MKLWRRTQKKHRVQAALSAQFLKAKHPHISLIGLLRKAKVAVLPAHEYIPVPSNSPAAQQNVARRTALGGSVRTIEVPPLIVGTIGHNVQEVPVHS